MAEACVSRDGRRNIPRSRRARQAGAKSSEANGKRKQKTANQQQVGSPVILDSDGGNLKQLKPPPWAFEKRGPAVSRRESDQVQLQGHEAQRPFRC